MWRSQCVAQIHILQIRLRATSVKHQQARKRELAVLSIRMTSVHCAMMMSTVRKQLHLAVSLSHGLEYHGRIDTDAILTATVTAITTVLLQLKPLLPICQQMCLQL
jgi:hypothetical protein